jgi:DNA-binding NarL/FixJ family response regulator
LAAALDDEADLELAGQAGTLDALRGLLDDMGNPVDLVLLDIELPDGSAVDPVAELARRARVVMVSAHDDPRLVRQALLAGAIGYVRKDSEPDEVLRLVRRAAEGRTALTGDMAMRLAEVLREGSEPASFGRVLAGLSPRQRDVVALVAEGRSNREIAAQLHLSEGTVKNHVSGILDQAGVADRTNLAVLYVRHQLAGGRVAPT